MINQKDESELFGLAGNSLIENVNKRKRKLHELRMELEKKNENKCEESKSIAEENGEKAEGDFIPITFRSYNPSDQKIGINRVEPDLFIVEKKIDEQLMHTQDTKIKEQVDITTLAPKKVDWDLKRDIAEKLQKLERLTQKSLAQLIRNRLAEGKVELTVAVNASTALNEAQFDD